MAVNHTPERLLFPGRNGLESLKQHLTLIFGELLFILWELVCHRIGDGSGNCGNHNSDGKADGNDRRKPLFLPLFSGLLFLRVLAHTKRSLSEEISLYFN